MLKGRQHCCAPTRLFSCLPGAPSLCHRPPCESLPRLFFPFTHYFYSTCHLFYRKTGKLKEKKTEKGGRGRSPLGVGKGRRATRTHHLLFICFHLLVSLSCNLHTISYVLSIDPFLIFSLFTVSVTRLCERWEMGKGRVGACMGGYTKTVRLFTEKDVLRIQEVSCRNGVQSVSRAQGS